jgi:hypothetical protein
MVRRKREDSEQTAMRRGKLKVGKQAEEPLRHMDVGASPHLEQMSASWQRVYEAVVRVVRS